MEESAERISGSKHWMRPREAARALGCSERRLKILVWTGQLRAYRWSTGQRGDLHIRVEDIEDFLADHLVAGPEPRTQQDPLTPHITRVS